MAEFAPAAFRRGALTFEVDGRLYTFPSLSAAEWLDILASPAWVAHAFNRLDDVSYDAFLARVDAGEATPRDLARVMNEALTLASGRPWWEAQRLAHVVTSSPGLLGSVLLRGVDPERLTLAAFLAVAWVALMQGRDDTTRTQLEMELSAPPPEALEDEMSQETDMATLVASMRAVPGVSIG